MHIGLKSLISQGLILMTTLSGNVMVNGDADYINTFANRSEYSVVSLDSIGEYGVESQDEKLEDNKKREVNQCESHEGNQCENREGDQDNIGVTKKTSFRDALGIIDESYAVDAEIVERWLSGEEEADGEKQVFLTFDDGPSRTITPKVLDILKEKDVKATFFQCGEMIELSKSTEDLVQRVHEEGHAIGNHFYIHDIVKINTGKNLNGEYCKKQLKKNDETFKKVLGDDFNCRIMRMPGGFASKERAKYYGLDEFKAYLKNNSIYSIEWNALSGDADGTNKNRNQLVQEVKKTAEDRNKVIVLMHDTYGKEETVKALPEIIDYFKNEGFQFKVIV